MSRRVAPPVLAGGVPERYWEIETLPPKRPNRPKVDPCVRHAIFARDRFACRNCGSERDLTIDHIKPLSKGGKNRKENLQTLCVRCNSEKADR